MRPHYPPLTLFFIPSDGWSSLENGQSFEIIQNNIDASFRRFIKGVNRSQEQNHLLKWLDQLKAFTPLAVTNKTGISCNEISTKMLPEWSRLLTLLAEAQSKDAVRRGAPDGTPPFLSCIWGPPLLQTVHQTQFYQSTVDSHLTFLNTVIPGDEPAFEETMAYRKTMFNMAMEKSLGMIEYTGDLFENFVKDMP